MAANPAATLLLARDAPAGLPGYPLDCLFPPASQPLIRSRLTHVITGGHPLSSVPERIIRLDGQERDVEISIAAFPGLDQALLAIRDVTERHKVEAALAFTAGQLRALAKRQDALVEEERQRIAREIHDELGQQLTLAKLRLAALRPAAGSTLADGLDDASATIDGAIRMVRRVRPPAIRPSWIHSGSRRPSNGRPGFSRTDGHCGGSGRVEEFTLDDASSTALFRILQEALTNIARGTAGRNSPASLSIGRRRMSCSRSRTSGIGM